MSGYKECSFELANYQLSGRRYGSSNGHKVIALHGWLDNCASFELVAPVLENYDLVALDFAGNGRSDHRSADSEYAIWSDVQDVIAVANELGWESFSMIGHSRGAAVCMLTAGACSDRVDSVSVIDGGIPMIADASVAASTLATAIEQRLSFKPSKGRLYESIEQAAFARSRGMWPLSADAALWLAKRGVEAVDQGYRWLSDKRLNLASEVRLTSEQFLSFVNAIDCSVKVIMAEQGIAQKYPVVADNLATLLPFDLVYLPGGHHLHLEQETFQAVANTVLEHLNSIADNPVSANNVGVQ